MSQEPGRERTEVVVVGAGLLGLSAARALRARGREVLVLERETVGHARGGSKGASRIFRLGYVDPGYVRMAMDARPLWEELEAEMGCRLLEPTGQLTFGAGMSALRRAMTDAGAPVRAMPAAEVHERFPDLAVPGDALFEPESAVIDAAATLAALRRTVGDVLREQVSVTDIVDDGRRVHLTTEGGDIEADVAVVCPGPWSAKVLALETFATLEHVAYFRRHERERPPMPIFIEFAEPAVYGLPTAAMAAFKLALHHAGPGVDPDCTSLDPQAEQVDAIVRAAARLLPAFDPTPVHVETCMYDNTASEEFVLECRGRVVIGAGTSGHGFKFGPLLGERLADLATTA
jgi:sarcosine oxidase